MMARLLFAFALLFVFSFAACNEDSDKQNPADGDKDQSGEQSETDGDTTPDGDTDQTDGDTAMEGDATETEGEESPDGDADGENLSAPSITNIYIRILGEFPFVQTLGEDDVVQILPIEAQAEFTVTARDDVSERKNLTASVMSADTGEAVAGQAAQFSGGNWKVTLTVAPGKAYRVRVADEAGNETLSPSKLTLPALLDVIADDRDYHKGSYEWRQYGTEENILTRYHLSFLSDGTWTETHEDGYVRGGTYAMAEDGENLRIAETTHCSADGTDKDENPSTVESAREEAFYVDSRYFASEPFLWDQEGSPVTVTGKWKRERKVYTPIGGVLTQTDTVTETYTFTDTRFVRKVESTTNGTVQTEGAYEIKFNSNYMDNFGNFLIFTAETENGNPVTRDPWAELYTIRAGRLLISPYLFITTTE